MACPDANLIVEFAEARLEAAERERVLAHLERCRSCTALVAEAARSETVLEDGPKPPAGEPELPRTLDRYAVVSVIGRGGMGEVLAAFDPVLERQVAIKVLRPGPATQNTRKRAMLRDLLLHEARVMARLSHPNVVAVHDVVVVREQVCVVMELIKGTTLGKHLREHPSKWHRIRDLFVDAARGLAAAHNVGVVHRDFKPSNVLVGVDGRVSVVDFGLAGSSAIGLHGGTPAYTAPEQKDGQDVDARADQYSFCVALFEALHGHRPGEGKADANVRGALGPVPAWIDAALERGLKPEPADRFADLGALVAALRRDARSRQRSLLVLGVVAAISGGVSWAATRASSAQTEAEMEQRIDALTGEAETAAAQRRYIYPSAEDPAAPTALLKLLELEALGDPDARERAAKIRANLAQELLGLGDAAYNDAARRGFANDFYAWALVFDPESVRARDRVELTPGEVAALRQRAAQGSFSPQELEAVEPATALAEGDVNRMAKLLARRAGPPRDGASKADPSRPAPTAAQRSSPPDREATPTPTPTRVEGKKVPVDDGATTAMVQRGRQALARGDIKAAKREFHGALGQDPRKLGAALGLSDAYYEDGHYEQARGFANRAVKIAPRSGQARVQLGDCYYKLHRLPEARDEYQRAVDLRHKPAKKRLKKIDALLGG